MKRIEIEIEDGALTDAPVWKDHKRGRNWMARVKKNPQAPGGLAREFAQRAHGGYYYIWPVGWKIGDVVEFGADYYSTRGVKHPKRWYGIIVEVHEDKIVLVGDEMEYPDAVLFKGLEAVLSEVVLSE